MINKKKLFYLYNIKKLSMMDIAKQVNATHATVYYWLKKYGATRRSWRDSAYVKHNPSGDPYRIKAKLSNKDKILLACGLMLYCGEGHRKNKHSVQLANLDPLILKVFVNFLRKICGIKERKLSLYVQLYKKFNKKEALEYWSQTLMIPKRQIGIYDHTDSRSKPEGQKSKFGIARIQFNNYKLKNWIENEANNYLNQFSKTVYLSIKRGIR